MKKIERDIDDVLASIDEMLAKKEPHTAAENEKKTLIQQAAGNSASTLRLSSNPPTTEKDNQDTSHTGSHDEETDDTDTDDIEEEDKEQVTSQHRILLTEALLAPTKQETLPLWVEQTADAKPATLEEKNETQKEDCGKQLKEPMPQQAEETADTTASVEDNATENQNNICINRDQLEQLIEVISRDVSRQLNLQVQKIVPRLVSASLVRHLASLKKDNS